MIGEIFNCNNFNSDFKIIFFNKRQKKKKKKKKKKKSYITNLKYKKK